MPFTSRLRDAIASSGMTKKDLCEKAGISAAGLNNYLRGQYSPDLDTASRLAKELGTTVGFLIGETDAQDEIPVPRPGNLPRIKPAALGLLGRSYEELADDVGATSKQIRDWETSRSQPTHGQLILLFNELYKAAASVKNQLPRSLPAIEESLRQGNDV